MIRPNRLALVFDSFPPEGRGKALGWLISATGIGASLGWLWSLSCSTWTAGGVGCRLNAFRSTVVLN